jgi:hypothetical protein
MDDYVGVVVTEGVGVEVVASFPDGEGDDGRFWSELHDGLGL